MPFLNEVTVSQNQATSDLGAQWQAAIEARNSGRISELLDLHPHLSHQMILDRNRNGTLSKKGLDPLYQCASTGGVEIVELLLSRGCAPSRIQDAVGMAAPEVADILLKFCPNAKPDLELLTYIGEFAAVKFWTDRGCPVTSDMIHNACCARREFRGHKKPLDTAAQSPISCSHHGCGHLDRHLQPTILAPSRERQIGIVESAVGHESRDTASFCSRIVGRTNRPAGSGRWGSQNAHERFG